MTVIAASRPPATGAAEAGVRPGCWVWTGPQRPRPELVWCRRAACLQASPPFTGTAPDRVAGRTDGTFRVSRAVGEAPAGGADAVWSAVWTVCARGRHSPSHVSTAAVDVGRGRTPVGAACAPVAALLCAGCPRVHAAVRSHTCACCVSVCRCRCVCSRVCNFQESLWHVLFCLQYTEQTYLGFFCCFVFC